MMNLVLEVSDFHRNFAKSDVCEREVDFGRPCRGLSPGKGFRRERERLHIACRDDKQYFKEMQRGEIEQ